MAGFLGEDLVLWHNHIGQEFTKEQMLSFVGDALKVLQKVEFRNARHTASETGCIQQHDQYCEMGDGGMVDNAPQVIVYTVRDGLIRRIEDRFPAKGGAPEPPPLPPIELMWERRERKRGGRDWLGYLLAALVGGAASWALLTAGALG